jgi:hypothetical protein
MKITNWGLPLGSNFGGGGGGCILRYCEGIPFFPFRATTTKPLLFFLNELAPVERRAGFCHADLGWERDGRTMERREDILVTSILHTKTRERERGEALIWLKTFGI